MPTAQRSRSPRSRRFIVCGDNPLAYRLVHELVTRFAADVTVVLPSRARNRGPQIGQVPGVRIIESSEVDDAALRAAGAATAGGLALVSQDDVGNIHAALRAHDLNHGLRLVVRVFSVSLGRRVRMLFDDCVVLSDSAMAEPAFVAAALGELAPSFIRLPGRTLHLARRAEVPAASIVCGAADTSGSTPRLLPADQDSADLVLAVADGATRPPLVRQWFVRRFLRRSDSRVVRLWRRRLLANRLVQVALMLFGLLVAGVAVLATAAGYGWWTALYLALMDTAGTAQPDADLPPVIKAVQVALTIVSISIVPVVTAAVVDGLVRARLARIGHIPTVTVGHVVVVGLGNVGTRVVRRLRDLGLSVVGVDNDEGARGVRVARELGVPVVFGEATRAATLERASVATSRAVLLLTSSDAVNLEAALQARSVREDIRVVLGLFDSDMAERVERFFDINASFSVSYLAASAFAAAMVEQRVIGTIPIGRHVLMIAEVPVGPGAPLVGEPLHTAHDQGEVRVIGLQRKGAVMPDWTPDPEYRLAVQDRLTVLATRAGLGLILAQSSTPAAHPEAG
ncbi:MAG TPA: NAD-binding protein [Pseudonocardiaceae bacterium]|nr:NAD-binding protein [Pseudonocardiaceae bacterium]